MQLETRTLWETRRNYVSVSYVLMTTKPTNFVPVVSMQLSLAKNWDLVSFFCTTTRSGCLKKIVTKQNLLFTVLIFFSCMLISVLCALMEVSDDKAKNKKCLSRRQVENTDGSLNWPARTSRERLKLKSNDVTHNFGIFFCLPSRKISFLAKA